MTRYFDHEGNERDADWWRSIYGDGASVHSPDGSRARIVELHDSGPNAGMDVQIVTRGAMPDGFRPTLYWPDGIIQAERKTMNTWETLVFACYAPPDVGPYWIDVGYMCDSLRGLGWICETNHQHPQIVVYEATGDFPPPEPPPPPPPELPVDEIIVNVRAIEGALELQAAAVAQFATSLARTADVIAHAAQNIREIVDGAE